MQLKSAVSTYDTDNDLYYPKKGINRIGLAVISKGATTGFSLLKDQSIPNDSIKKYWINIWVGSAVGID